VGTFARVWHVFPMWKMSVVSRSLGDCRTDPNRFLREKHYHGAQHRN
jgi:hypothetical protein